MTDEEIVLGDKDNKEVEIDDIVITYYSPFGINFVSKNKSNQKNNESNKRR